MQVLELPPLTTNVSELTADQVYEFLEKMPIKPDYVDFNQSFNQANLDRDCEMNGVLVVNSPNFPKAGKGLISNRPAVITKETGLPYWGQVFLHFFKERTLNEIPFDNKCKERLFLVPVQPFKHVGIELYILGSLSCASTYSNDAQFNGWEDESRKKSHCENNCRFWCSTPIDEQTIGGVINWLKSCPVWIESSKRIVLGEEFLTGYFD